VAVQKFGKEFWIDLFKSIGYPVNLQEFPLSLIREQKILPPNTNPLGVYRVFSNGLVDVIVTEVKEGEFSRGRCVNLARSWKKNNLLSPVMIMTNSKDSYVSILPGTSFNSEAKVLYLSDQLYYTDKLVLESLKNDPDKVVLLKRYNEEFFPYQKVRDEFFTGYSKMFQELQESLISHLGLQTRSFSQKFLGRLMFLYFLQKKGWLKNDKHFVDSIQGYEQLSDIYYNGLNTGKLEGIPFLNGSLFDREDYLSDEKEAEISEILNDMFLKARKFFNNYNFTVDETSPLEVEVSIDPALIGTVFENLLLEKERGKKGTFYTPKNETSFICRRALVKYLGLEDGFSADEKEVSDGIQTHLETLRKTKKIDEIRELKDKLLKVKVVDPAVGSGGFLVIMMQEIVSTIIELDAIAGWKSDSYEYKKEVHRNLFGFDIEPEAVEIARLRLWLSMIIDQEVPVPLPNLEFKIVDIPDSLQLESFQKKIESEIEEERDLLGKLIEQYSNEHDHENKVNLKQRIALHTRNLSKYGLNPNVIESYMVDQADIVVMNPPYVRQESIDPERKKYYIDTYKFDKKSDIYVYFFQRALRLLKPNGVVTAITSDKWLETSYGIKLQEHLKSRLISVYGQRNRSFEADVNTVITVYSNEMQQMPVNFVYLESYGSRVVRRKISLERRDLKPGKWFYLRAPQMFMEKIYPKLTHRLGDFAEIKFGIKTGANDFFYIKDVSASYEADYLANPKKFEDWVVSAKNEKELKEQGLIYIENEGGQRFVINRSDTKPLVRTTKEIKTYSVKEMGKLCLYTKIPGEMTKKYIKWGQEQRINIKGRKDPVIGYNNVPSVSGRRNWYSLNDLEPANIILPMYVMDRFFVPKSDDPVICDHTLYTITSKVKGIESYLNSTMFYLTMELYLRRLGGGGGVGEIMVDDYEQMPVPDLQKIDLTTIKVMFERYVKRYFEEVKMEDRRQLDGEILKLLSIENSLLDEFYKEFIELVDDRLIKADRGLKSLEINNDEDN
jgi:type II restriction/modification system DNA methylase subunit YeeA